MQWYNWHIGRHEARKVRVLIWVRHDQPKRYIDLCTQCFMKRLSKIKRPNTSSKQHNRSNPRRKYEYYLFTSIDTRCKPLQCMDCGWTTKGK